MEWQTCPEKASWGLEGRVGSLCSGLELEAFNVGLGHGGGVRPTGPSLRRGWVPLRMDWLIRHTRQPLRQAVEAPPQAGVTVGDKDRSATWGPLESEHEGDSTEPRKGEGQSARRPGGFREWVARTPGQEGRKGLSVTLLPAAWPGVSLGDNQALRVPRGRRPEFCPARPWLGAVFSPPVSHGPHLPSTGPRWPQLCRGRRVAATRAVG